jgi:transglutaminase-like putative cysteine protease
VSVPTLEARVANVHSEPLDVVLGPSGSFERQIAHQVSFLNYKGIDWDSVVRARVFSFQQFAYVYPSLVTDLSQRLIVKPRQAYGDQTLLDFKLGIEPIPLEKRLVTDTFGNAVIEIEVAAIDDWTTFEVIFCVERYANQPAPTVTDTEARGLTQATIFTRANSRMLEVASALRMRAKTPLELSERICDWVSNAMTYKSGVTGVATTASQALELGAGLCQDYAHIALALLRAAGLPARYVSGHMLGEGGSHAWLEVIIPNQHGKLEAIGFDPTNARRPNLGYTVVALGRDYSDVPPTTGSYIGDHAGELYFEKRAGLVELEFTDARVLSTLV